MGASGFLCNLLFPFFLCGGYCYDDTAVFFANLISAFLAFAFCYPRTWGKGGGVMTGRRKKKKREHTHTHTMKWVGRPAGEVWVFFFFCVFFFSSLFRHTPWVMCSLVLFLSVFF